MTELETKSAELVSPPDATEEQSEEKVCKHHWEIEPPTGPFSQGVCQFCGEVREFNNSIPEQQWGDRRIVQKPQNDPNEPDLPENLLEEEDLLD